MCGYSLQVSLVGFSKPRICSLFSHTTQHMAVGDRVTLGLLGFLSCGTFAAIFVATQERKIERYKREGKPLPPGSRG